MKAFRYTSGEEVLTGDKITVASKPGTIEKILSPQTQDATDFSCPDTGGLLIKFDDGDLQVWPDVDEDLILVRHGPHPRKAPGA